MRIETIKKALTDADADAFIISSYQNRRYISAFTGSEGLLVITTKDKPLLLVDGRYTIQAKEQAKGFDVVQFNKGPYSLLEKFFYKRIFVEEEKITLSQCNKLREVFPDVEFLTGSNILNNLRAIKTKEEAASIKKAAAIADKAFLHILDYIKPGQTEKEVALELNYFMQKNGADGIAFDTIIASSVRSALPHAQPTTNKIPSKGFVVLDFGCVFDGYCSDITRTISMGAASTEMVNVYNTVLRAQQKALKKIKNGVLCNDVDKIARDEIDSAGFGNNFVHSLGHGVGLEVHEKPVLSSRSESVLKAGNVVTVEPGIYIEDKFGVRIEDLVVVTEQGCINLTTAPKELIEKK
ncbi:MAG: aminopeptidase P family protein [Clostridiaceae bacterium]|nr:aminopeptidase P family protein [Clostridiaceae bacterium]